MTVEHARAAFERWHAAVQQGVDLMSAMSAVASPDCLVHSQNGEIGPMQIVAPQMAQVRLTFPDLEAEIEHTMITEDRIALQLLLEGTPTLAFGPGRAGTKVRAASAIVARVNERAELVELWPYPTPGAVFTFPPRKDPAPPPTVTATPGNEGDARAIWATWRRAITGAEFVDRIIETARPDCLVHATNGDRGGIDLVEEQFSIVGSAFPDVTIEFEDAVFDAERFLGQFVLQGTHRGQLGILPPTGRRVESTGAIAARADITGHAMELWLYLAPGMGLMFPRSDRPRA